MQHANFIGYWFPYEAARAMAAKFCWRIRFALTIVFGEDFPKDCLDPEADEENFGRYNIDPAIIVACTHRVRKLREVEIARRQQKDSKASAAANSPPPNARYATPPEGTRTPPRSTYPTASPELMVSSMSREQAHGSRYFDPVRDSSRSGPFGLGSNTTYGQPLYPSLPSPSGWPNPLPSPIPNSSLNQYHFNPQFRQRPMPESSVDSVRSNVRHHPLYQYHQYSYTVGQGISTPARGGGVGGNPGYGSSQHPQVWRGSAEALMTPPAPATTPYYTPRQSHQQLSINPSVNPVYTYDTPMYPPIMPPAEQPLQQYTQPFSPAIATELPQVIPQRRESTETHLDPAHLPKRPRVSGRDQDPKGFEHEDDYRARMFVRLVSPSVVDSHVEAEGDVAEAAAGLMSLNQRDIELERENGRRRNST